MHVLFTAPRRHAGSAADPSAPEPADDAGQMHVARDPDDESEWQYLGNPEIAVRTSLREVVARFIADCRNDDGSISAEHIPAARQLKAALLLAASQIDDALRPPGVK